MISTRTWWLKQAALMATVLGAAAFLAGVVGLLNDGGATAVGVAVAGLGVAAAAAWLWRRLAGRHSVELLEQQIYGPE